MIERYTNVNGLCVCASRIQNVKSSLNIIGKQYWMSIRTVCVHSKSPQLFTLNDNTISFCVPWFILKHRSHKNILYRLALMTNQFTSLWLLTSICDRSPHPTP